MAWWMCHPLLYSTMKTLPSPSLPLPHQLQYTAPQLHPAAIKGPVSKPLTLQHIYTHFKKTSGLKKEEVTQGWWKLHKKEFHSFYSSSNIAKLVKWRRQGSWVWTFRAIRKKYSFDNCPNKLIRKSSVKSKWTNSRITSPPWDTTFKFMARVQGKQSNR